MVLYNGDPLLWERRTEQVRHHKKWRGIRQTLLRQAGVHYGGHKQRPSCTLCTARRQKNCARSHERKGTHRTAVLKQFKIKQRAGINPALFFVGRSYFDTGVIYWYYEKNI